jgi:hypothetical protein
MGMDVFGTSPTAEAGKYFCANVWSWRTLVAFLCTVAPEITEHCEYWNSNDGDGLDAEHSAALAAKVRQELSNEVSPGMAYRSHSGSVHAFEFERIEEFSRFLESCGGFEIW